MPNSFPENSADDDAWTGAEAENDGQPLLIRLRPNLADFDGRPAFAQKLLIRWKYGNDGESGMPDSEQSDDMRTWEDSLVRALEQIRVGILAYVFTYQGVREWHIYFSSMDGLQEALDIAVAGLPQMPLHMEVSDDAEWSEYFGLTNSIQAPPSE